jgi:dTDP-4-amino-4,6-dideoxygalactose transaminase
VNEEKRVMRSLFALGQLAGDGAFTKRCQKWLADFTGAFHARGLRTPIVPPSCEANFHLYYVLMPNPDLRRELITRMKADGISTPFHYVPLHSSPAGLRFARTFGSLRHTEDLSARLVRLDASRRVVERLQVHLDGLL